MVARAPGPNRIIIQNAESGTRIKSLSLRSATLNNYELWLFNIRELFFINFANFAACGVLQMRHARHNSIVRLIGEAARREMSMVPDYSYAISSSTTSDNNIDLVLESFHLQPPSVGIDVTVSHPLLPTYSAAAALDSQTMFLHRERTKDLHHRAGCINQGKSFLPVVFSTLSGVSPRAREFLDYLFRCAHTTEIESGGTGQHTIARRQLFYDEIAAVIARSGTAMSLRLGSPPHPSDFD